MTGRFRCGASCFGSPPAVPPRQPQPLQSFDRADCEVERRRMLAGVWRLPVQGRRLPHTVSPVRDRRNQRHRRLRRGTTAAKSRLRSPCTPRRDFSMQSPPRGRSTAPDHDRDVLAHLAAPGRRHPILARASVSGYLAPASSSGQEMTTSCWQAPGCRKPRSRVPLCCHAAAAVWRRPGCRA